MLPFKAGTLPYKVSYMLPFKPVAAGRQYARISINKAINQLHILA
jgi:hypothetical protein